MPNVSNISTRLTKGVFASLLIFAVALAICMTPSSAYADGDGTAIKVDSVSASPGDTVQVAATIEGNPGILGATLQVAYDEGLTLTGATSGDAFSALSMTKPGSFSSPCRFTWDGLELSAGDVKDGQILVLSFVVSDDAERGANYNVTVSGDSGAVLDADLNEVDVTYIAGGVSIVDFIPGDLDGDKIINSKDVIYARRHIVGGYTQAINVVAADVNNDLKVNSADVILLRRYIAGGYNVELKRSGLNSGSNPVPGPNPEHAHSLEAVAAKSPTCTEAGNIAYWHCSSCNQYFSDAAGQASIQLEETVVEATGHTPVVDAAVAPTQTTTGLTEGSHCSVCGTVLKEQQIIPAPPHHRGNIRGDLRFETYADWHEQR